MSQKAFSHIVQDLRDGRVHAELSQQFSELINKVQETGKAGELTLKLKIKPATLGARHVQPAHVDTVRRELSRWR